LSGLKISPTSDLSGVTLSSSNLSNTDFTLCRFNNTTISSGTLSGTNLSRTEIRDTNFSGLTLSNVNLTYADLSGIDLSNKNLSTVTFIGIILNNVNLTNTSLNNLNLTDSKFNNMNLVQNNFSNITFFNTLFKNIDLSGSTFTSCNLIKSKFIDSNLQNVNLSNFDLTSSIIQNTNLTNTNLTNTILYNASLIDLNLSNRNLTNYSIQNAILQNINFNNTILDNLDLSGSTLIDLDLSNINLNGLNLSNIKFSNVDFTNSKFINVNFFNATIENYPYLNKIEIDLSGKLINPNLSNCKIINVNMNNNDLSNCNLSNILLRNVNLTNCNLSNCNLSNGDLSDNVILTNTITGPLSNSTNLKVPNNYEIINNFISGFDINDTSKLSLLSTLLTISNNTITDLCSNLFNFKLLGSNEEQQYNELARLYNNIKVTSNKINVKNLNKDGFWINASITNTIINDISDNEYIYLLNVPNYDVSLNISNTFIGTIKRVNDSFIFNGRTYYVNDKIFIDKYRITFGSLLLEKPNLNQIITGNNQSLNVKFFENIPINGNIYDLPITTYDLSVNYLLYSGFKGSISKFNITSNITELNDNKLLLELDLPNITDTTKTLKLYKIVNKNLVIDSNYPVDVKYDNIINKWITILPTLSDFVVIDENIPETILGGDPYIKNIKSDQVIMLPNSWKKVILYQSDKYQVIGYNEKLPASKLLTMKKYLYNREVELTKLMLIGYQFNYLVKLEIIDLENKEKSILDTLEGNILENNNNIEEISTKNGLNSVDKNFYYPKKNLKGYNINLDRGNIITIKVDNYWIDLNNIKLYANNIEDITGELIEHDENNNID